MSHVATNVFGILIPPHLRGYISKKGEKMQIDKKIVDL